MGHPVSKPTIICNLTGILTFRQINPTHILFPQPLLKNKERILNVRQIKRRMDFSFRVFSLRIYCYGPMITILLIYLSLTLSYVVV